MLHRVAIFLVVVAITRAYIQGRLPYAGTTADNDALIGSYACLSADMDRMMVRLHDGVTAGGVEVDYTINVKRYGAKGDGVTDDTAAINAAIQGTEAGNVYIPAAKYIISDPIVMKVGVNLVGDSHFANPSNGLGSELYLANGSNCAMISAPPDTPNIVVRGIYLEGNKANQTGGTSYGLYLDHNASGDSDRSLFEDLFINGIDGVGIYNTRKEASFHKCKVQSCTSHGYEATSNCSDTTLVDVLSGHNGGHGVFLNGCSGHFCRYVASYNNDLNGLYVLNSSNNDFVILETDTNGQAGVEISAGAASYSRNNRIISGRIYRNSQTTDDTYSNLTLAGAGSAVDNVFIGCVLWDNEDTYDNRPYSQVADTRTAYASTKGDRLVFIGCSFNSDTALWRTEMVPTDFWDYAKGIGNADFTGGAVLPEKLHGKVTNTVALAGDVGELKEAERTSASLLALTTATAADITTLALTAGSWDVTGYVGFIPDATTVVQQAIGSISLTTATLGGNDTRVQTSQLTYGGYPNEVLPLPTLRVRCSGNTTIYLVGYATFTTAALNAFGKLRATRVC